METQLFNFITTSDYSVDVQVVEGIPYLHVNVGNWKPSVLKDMYVMFNRLQCSLRNLGFTEMQTITPNPKFVKIFGGETIKTVNEYEVIKWDLTQLP